MSNNTLYAIEITEYYQGIKRKKGGSINRLELSKMQKLMNCIQTAYESKCSLHLNVSITWSAFEFSKLDDTAIMLIADIFSEKLVKAAHTPILWSFNNLEAFVDSSDLSNYLYSINISHINSWNEQKNYFSFTESGNVEDPIPKLKSIISQKLSKLETYKMNLAKQEIECDNFWLLIEANGRHISSTANFYRLEKWDNTELDALEKSLEYTFNKIFIYDPYFCRFGQLK